MGKTCPSTDIEFPSYDDLIEIVNAHFPDSLEQKLVKKAVSRFRNLRKNGSSRRDGKKASTSELLDWIRWLKRYPQKAWEIIKNLPQNKPLLGALLKTKEDQERYQNNYQEEEEQEEEEEDIE
ncbi:MAG: hypothetical protein QNJ32_26245 [Xenococcaceae cyanobacterium MO_167.B27]|nr:hypothetical protein [Xenococcaceae cyanobacterium MO_167.B27]